MPIPAPKALPVTEDVLPNFFVADAAFPLTENLMKPYPGTLLSPEKEKFNKRLSRARRTIENAFGILVARWRILLGTLHLAPHNAEKIVLACIALHNFIMLNDISRTKYCSPDFVDWTDTSGQEYPGEWRAQVANQNIISVQASRTTHRLDGIRSTNVRNKLTEYFLRS